jgi:hypothetical protein
MFATYVMLALSFALSVDVSTKVLAIITKDFMIFSQFLTVNREIRVYDYFSVSVHYIGRNAARNVQATSWIKHKSTVYCYD